MNKLRITIIAPQPFVETRGTPIANLRLARALADAGHSVDIITYPFGSDPEHERISVHRCPRPPMVRSVKVGLSPQKVALDLSLAAYAVGVTRRTRPDVVHGVEEGAFIAALLCRRRSCPLVYDMDSVLSCEIASGPLGSLRPLTSIARSMEAWAINRSTMVMTISQSMADYVLQVNSSIKIAVVPDVPIYDDDADALVRPHDLLPESRTAGRRIIMYTGSFAVYQGLDMLVKAMPAVARAQPDALLVIAGGSEAEVSRLRRTARAEGVEGSLLLLGMRPQRQIPALLRAAEVLVSPRLGGINPPAKLYTYMNSGRPTVLTDIPAHTTIAGPDAAVIADVSSEGLASAILWVLGHPEEARRRAARAVEAVSEFTPELQTNRIVEAYDYMAGICADAGRDNHRNLRGSRGCQD